MWILIKFTVFLFVCYWSLRWVMDRYTSTEVGGCMVVFPWVIGLIGVIIVFFLDLARS
jgi:hypothetical protein